MRREELNELFMKRLKSDIPNDELGIELKKLLDESNKQLKSITHEQTRKTK